MIYYENWRRLNMQPNAHCLFSDGSCLWSRDRRGPSSEGLFLSVRVSGRRTSALSGVGALRGRQISTRPLKDVMKPERSSSYKDPNPTLSRLEYQPI